MWKEGQYVALMEPGAPQYECAIIGRVAPANSGFWIGDRQFNSEGRQLWVPQAAAARVRDMTREIENDIAQGLLLPEVGSVWLHDEMRYEVIDVANVRAGRPDFLPTVIYRAVDTETHGPWKFARSVVRWHARLRPEPAPRAVAPAPPSCCEARQYSDQMRCSACGTVWDTNDPDPPTCKATGQRAPENGSHARS